ncbi:MAG: glucosylceramidase [Rhodothermales bacterium]|nr:glucosylceramidase [Rhodothermales bacterium]
MAIALVGCQNADSRLGAPARATDVQAQVNNPAKATDVQAWVTDPANSLLFERSDPAAHEPSTGTDTIFVDPGTTYQEIDGFGWALTGGSAALIHGMSAAARAQLLEELFGHGEDSIGGSYLRVSIGASDLDPEVFSYAEVPGDVELEHFTLDRDRRHLIPILKEILTVQPDLKIMGSPWSPPVWMKSNESSVGGTLLPRYHDVYAEYFVRYIQAMADEGIRIDAITPQNEPLHPGNNPSLLMPATQQATFIKESLGPAFERAGIDTRIVIYDHNADRPDYPLTILDDPEAKAFVDGTAFHLYGGEIEALSTVRDRHPDRSIYFTEQWVGAPGSLARDLRWHVRELIVGATRNWSRIVIEWNLAADQNQDPHTPGGCDRCLGAVTIQGDAVTRNPAYYIIAHAAKFVAPGSRRIASSASTAFPNVAFRRPDGGLVLVVLNDTEARSEFAVRMGSRAFDAVLSEGAVATFLYHPN